MGGCGQEHAGPEGGLVALAAALNAIEVDPGRLWEGPWRWHSAMFLGLSLPSRAACPDSAWGLAAVAATAVAAAVAITAVAVEPACLPLLPQGHRREGYIDEGLLCFE